MAQSVVYLDLNGTLAEPVHDPDSTGFTPLPGAYQAINLLTGAGFACCVVTVQVRIARGVFTEAAFRNWFDLFEAEAALAGGRIDGLYLCPHAPDQCCPCRKPGTALYEQAARDHQADPARSWAIGDTTGDLLAAHQLGVRAVLVLTGHGTHALHNPAPRDAVTEDVLAAAHHIIGRP